MHYNALQWPRYKLQNWKKSFSFEVGLWKWFEIGVNPYQLKSKKVILHHETDYVI